MFFSFMDQDHFLSLNTKKSNNHKSIENFIFFRICKKKQKKNFRGWIDIYFSIFHNFYPFRFPAIFK